MNNKKVNEFRDAAFMIIDNIAFINCKIGNRRLLRAIDLNNINYMAEFRFDRSIGRFSITKSTFSDGKRKYEMLYLVERNTEELVEELRNA